MSNDYHRYYYLIQVSEFDLNFNLVAQNPVLARAQTSVIYNVYFLINGDNTQIAFFYVQDELRFVN